jgi:hypothetical protein
MCAWGGVFYVPILIPLDFPALKSTVPSPAREQPSISSRGVADEAA